jgi:hypothetical protein
MDINVITFTLWFCLASHPNCTPVEDPTGPIPITLGFTTEGLCEAYFVYGVKHFPQPSGLVPRHTCLPKGDSI